MNILYIDANIFLGFYNSNRPEFKKLLNSIIEVKDKIFFTEQFKYEIDRNKLNVFKQSIDNYTKQVSLVNTILPEHLDKDHSSKLISWNNSRKELEIQIKESNNKLLEILNETLQNVSSSEDNVSKALSSLYKKSRKPSIDNLNKARLRKEIGNPPGKKSDPLGDQLSWEMLLNIAENINRIWIISKDQDYYTENKDVLYLNPILKNDLIQLNPTIEIKVFNKLSEALKDFNDLESIKSIPSKNELELISISESFDPKNYDSINNITDIEILHLLAEGKNSLEIKEFLNQNGEYVSLSIIEKRLAKLKDFFKANNTVHLVSITKDMGII
ncbi:PIN-like domain-containing protein [Flavobacterium defluvii]|uniref:PIN like domain-containing protein n=1 Tax=Flavobacterium defluvii TaxID=370979 RepID=A0A1M5SW65_9FLAO|nr:PIN domain-containing protein [Flavobacterium defluvii]SHH42640.1 hypothetical protein SAMN05443663_107238 [Flavobacterium defluvii]